MALKRVQLFRGNRVIGVVEWEHEGDGEGHVVTIECDDSDIESRLRVSLATNDIGITRLGGEYPRVTGEWADTVSGVLERLGRELNFEANHRALPHLPKVPAGAIA